MKIIIATLIALVSVPASAECWIVKGMHGIDYAQRNNYEVEKDGFSGTFMISENGKDASIRYSGTDAGGITYMVLSPGTFIGISNEANGQAIENWNITQDGTVKMTKMINGFGGFDSVKAMVGKVSGKC